MIKKIGRAFFIVVIALFQTTAQNIVREYGKVAKDELELKEYALDKNAEAVVLFDMGKSYFVESDNFFDVVYERTTRIKILSEGGTKWAEVEIPYYQEGNIYERVYEIEATSYNFENGKLIKSTFDIGNVYDEKVNEYWKKKKFAVPNVKVGTVIEYRYKINSEYKFNFRDWEFQWKIPVMYSEYEVKMIPFYEYIYILQGANKFDINETYIEKGIAKYFGSATQYGNNSYFDKVHKFGMKDIPAFGGEEFITSINDYIIKLDFQLAEIHKLNGTDVNIISTWKELITELLQGEKFGKYISKSEKIAPKLFDVQAVSKMSVSEKFDFVLDYVKQNYSWNEINSKYTTKSPNQLIEDKIGNCSEINLFTIGLLNSVGLEAYPIIISTRNNGKIKTDYPFMHFFNYVIIGLTIEENMILSDATEIYSMNNRIPQRCLNDKGLMIVKDKIEWVSLDCLFPSSTKYFIDIKFDKNELNGDILRMSTEYDALSLRNNYTNNTLKEYISSNNYFIIDTSIQIQNFEEKTKPFRLRYKLQAKPEIIQNKIYILPFLHESIEDNPLKQLERRFPIDMIYPKKRQYSSTLTIPDGYQVDYTPENMSISNEIFDLNYSIKTLGNKVQISFEYYFKKPIYQPQEYLQVKSHFNDIVKLSTEKIVFKEIGQ